jgi:hypothetical protein
MTTRLTPVMLQKIKCNKWIQDEELQLQMGLNETQETYQVFEVVMLNLAADMCKSWKQIYKANPRNKETFIQLCVAAILIDKWLKNRFDINESVRLRLLGSRLAGIVIQYKSYIRDNQ